MLLIFTDQLYNKKSSDFNDFRRILFLLIRRSDGLLVELNLARLSYPGN